MHFRYACIGIVDSADLISAGPIKLCALLSREMMCLRFSGQATARASAMHVYLWSLINYKFLHGQSTIVVVVSPLTAIMKYQVCLF